MPVGRQKAKMLEDGGLPCFLDSRSQGFAGGHRGEKHFASAHRGKGYVYSDRQQWRNSFQVAQLCTECFEHTTSISLTQVADRGSR